MCPTVHAPYDDEFTFYYTAYSEKYDTEFFIEATKYIFSITCYGCNEPGEEIRDNLDEARNDKRYFDIIDKMLSQYNYTMTRDYFSYAFGIAIKLKIDDNFNEEYYSKLLKINELINNEDEKMIEEKADASIICIYFEFKDKTFYRMSSGLYIVNEQGKSTSIDENISWNQLMDKIEEDDQSIDISAPKN